MADTEDKPKTKLSLKPGKLELKKTVEGGQVRQSFSHGRSKVVTVEVKKKRTFAPGPGDRMAEVAKEPEVEAPPAPAEEVEEQAPAVAAAPPAAEPVADRSRPQGPSLTDHEKAVRSKVLEDARRMDEESAAAAAAAAEEAAKRAAEAPPEPTPEEIAKQLEEEKVAEEARLAAEREEREREEKGKAAGAAGAAKLEARERTAESEEEESRKPGRRGKVEAPRRAPARRGEPRRREGKLTIADALDDNERVRSLASVKRARERQRQKEMPTEFGKIIHEVVLPETITVQDLASRMAERSVAVVKSLMKMGVMATGSDTIDADTAELIVEEFGHKVKRVSDADVEIGLEGIEDEEGQLETRPPVVTIMGHVDHGKTSLLDAIRDAVVAGGEAGGITQHIGAYQIDSTAGGRITFIDTPGHEAFTAMRARGAKVTDIVVLVVAADDGIMPQTIEAIGHAKLAEVPIIVAINKMDRPDANPQRIRTQLLEHELVVEAMGGEILDVEVSATERLNLDKLEEAILLQSELLDLKANPNRPADGTVVEAKVEQGRGTVATVLVQRGTLKTGDILVAGAEWGRVRAMADDRGMTLKEAGPSMPVEVIGLNGAPSAGDELVVVENEARAREVAEFRSDRDRTARSVASKRSTLEEMFESIKAGERKELPILIKSDVQGSGEAIAGSLRNIPQEEVEIQVLHQAVGGINESDVSLAQASGGVILGFNVRASRKARDLAEQEGVDIRYYSVIYELVDDVKSLVTGLMAPRISEHMLGNAEVREVFNVSKTGKVAGCYVIEGTVKRGAKVRLLRDDVVIHEGSLSTLKRFKDDAREVKENYECGMSFEAYQDLKVGDVIECFEIEETAPVL